MKIKRKDLKLLIENMLLVEADYQKMYDMSRHLIHKASSSNEAKVGLNQVVKRMSKPGFEIVGRSGSKYAGKEAIDYYFNVILHQIADDFTKFGEAFPTEKLKSARISVLKGLLDKNDPALSKKVFDGLKNGRLQTGSNFAHRPAFKDLESVFDQYNAANTKASQEKKSKAKSSSKSGTKSKPSASKDVINKKPSTKAMSKVDDVFSKNPSFKKACEKTVKSMGQYSDDIVKNSSRLVGAHYIDDVMKAGDASFKAGMKKIGGTSATRLTLTGASTGLRAAAGRILTVAMGIPATISFEIGYAVGGWIHNWLSGDNSSIIGSIKKSALYNAGLTYGPSDYINPLNSDADNKADFEKNNFPGLSPRDVDPSRKDELLALLYDAKNGNITDPDTAEELYNLYRYGYINKADWQNLYKETFPPVVSDIDVSVFEDRSDEEYSQEGQEEIINHYGYNYKKIGEDIYITKSPKSSASEENPIHVDPTKSERFEKAYYSIKKLFDERINS